MEFRKLQNTETSIPTNSLLTEFQKLMEKVWLGSSSPISVTSFKNAFGRAHGEFADGRQVPTAVTLVKF